MKIGDKIRTGVQNWLFKGMKGSEATMSEQGYNKFEEYNVWYEGDEQELARYYNNTSFNESDVRVKENYLYRNTFKSERIIHSGLPRLISDTMARLIFSGGVEITEENNQDRLDLILKNNKMNKQHFDGASKESGFGEFAYKLSIDTDLEEVIIIETVKPCSYNAVYYRDRLELVEFFEIYKEDKNLFKLVEIYGKGFIDYALFIKKGNKWNQTDLSQSKKTQELERVDFDTPIILAMVKTNKTILGRSDYEGIISEFDSLDEMWSTFSEEGRMAKTDIYYPQDKLINGQVDPRMVKRYVKVETAIDFESKIQYEQPDMRTDVWDEAINSHITNILANTGLSKTSIGLDGAGANASAASRRELEKASLRTRASRIEMWDEFLTEFYTLVLNAQDIFENNTPKDYEVIVTFGNYITDTIQEKVTQIKELALLGFVDNEFTLNYVFGDSVNEEEKQRILETLGERDLIE